MEPLTAAARDALSGVDFVLTDLDDTLTLDGRLPALSYQALEALEAAGKTVIVVTGRPAGWCDLIARFWPVGAVVGENGAFTFRYDRERRVMNRAFQRPDEQRARDQARLREIFAGIQRRYPEAKLSADRLKIQYELLLSRSISARTCRGSTQRRSRISCACSKTAGRRQRSAPSM